MACEPIKQLRLGADNLTFYVFHPKLMLSESLDSIINMVASTKDEDLERGWVSIENAIAYYIEPDPIECDLNIYLSDSPPDTAKAKRAFVHNITLDSGEVAIEEAVPDETYLVQVPPNHYAIYQLTYDYEVESEVARFALYLVPGNVETQGEITL